MRPSGGSAGALRLLVLLAIQVACSSGSDVTCNLGEYFCMSCPEGSYQPSYLDGTTGFHIKGAENGAKAGHSVASAGDFDGDGGCIQDFFALPRAAPWPKSWAPHTPLPSSSAFELMGFEVTGRLEHDGGKGRQSCHSRCCTVSRLSFAALAR